MQGNRYDVESFVEQVKWLQEPEFGDFKRKVGLYVNRLADDLAGQSSGSLLQQKQWALLEQMRFVCLYAPDGDMEATRIKVLQLAEQIKELS